METSKSAAIYSDPVTRPRLQDGYAQSVAAFRACIDATRDGGSQPATATAAAQTANADRTDTMIPDFETWLQNQKGLATTGQAWDMVDLAQQHLEYLQTNDPDSSSGVRTVFADGDRILGYITNDGSLVIDAAGSALQKVGATADNLGLTGKERIAYLEKAGAAELSGRFSKLQVVRYAAQTTPTRREFMEAWYPDQDVDAAYAAALSAAKANVEKFAAYRMQRELALNKMYASLIDGVDHAIRER